MKWMLCDGKSTADPIVYIKDQIKLNSLVLINEIPYWDKGSNQLIPLLKDNEIYGSIQSIVNRILDNIQSEFPNIQISSTDIQISSNIVRIKIKIGDVTELVDINRFTD